MAGAVFVPTFTAASPMVTPEAKGWGVMALYTIGDTLPNGYQSVGIPDGIGAYRLDKSTVRILVNHELTQSSGKPYTLGNGTSLVGARVSYFDIDRATKGVVNAGIAYTSIVNRAGQVVDSPSDLDFGALNRFCSSALFEANSFGPGRGLADRIYFAGEETGNGTAFALDTATGTLHAAPWLGRGAWENATLVDTGTTNKVGLILADDSTGYPMYLYVGEKKAGGDFLERNGLKDGKLYVWKADSGATAPSGFGSGTATGSWVEVTVFDGSKAGMAGYDSQGFADQSTLRAEAISKGAFLFSRPEDVATNPADTTLVALASTGSGSFDGGADKWGTVYTFDLAFDANGDPAATSVAVIYNGNSDPSRAMRSPDNLDWNGAGELLIQEDRSVSAADFGAVNTNEVSILGLSLDGTLRRIAVIDRSAVPAGQVDSSAADFGNWETSGIVDVSELWGLPLGRMFIGDVQAHGIKLGTTNLVEGGQIFLLTTNVPEPATWALLIAGFGVVGFAARRRNAVVAG
jgi:secreted PhoX family phosphatase